MVTTLNTSDIQKLLNIGERTARRIKAEVRAYSASKGRAAISRNKCLAVDFSEHYGIPIETIDLVLEMKKGA
ncbi:MAG: hypothetical protein IKG01_10395 [Lachnospiraceae bacterium]|nr:hypothetical protein [Oscillospiraceae bacterium]MBR3279288.1 hypothetical protein [Lachnospiraceae bacterium]